MTTTANNRQDIETKIIAQALKDEAYKQQLIQNSETAKAEIEKLSGEKLPAEFKVEVLQETADKAYLVLPYVASTKGLSDEELEAVASGVNIKLPCVMGSITFRN